jgi:hypothetical protein
MTPVERNFEKKREAYPIQELLHHCVFLFNTRQENNRGGTEIIQKHKTRGEREKGAHLCLREDFSFFKSSPEVVDNLERCWRARQTHK